MITLAKTINNTILSSEEGINWKNKNKTNILSPFQHTTVHKTNYILNKDHIIAHIRIQNNPLIVPCKNNTNKIIISIAIAIKITIRIEVKG